MNKAEAYKIVYEDLMNNGSPLFRGVFDAVHGDNKFLLGMTAAMDVIAGHVSDETLEEYNKIFMANYRASKAKAEKLKDKARKEKEKE